MTSRVRRPARSARGAAISLFTAVVAVACGGGRPRPEPNREPTAVGRLWNAGRHAVGVILRHPEDVIEPPPPDVRGRPWSYCENALAGQGFDLSRENSAAAAFVATLASRHRAPYDAIVVPGFTPLDAVAPQHVIHPIAIERLELALRDVAAGMAPLVIVSGGNVHPLGTPINEAMQMKQWLVAHGMRNEQIVVEPCARHSHTNLRNTGRFLLVSGLARALVTTSRDQAMYFGQPRSSSFDGRCLVDLGYVVGDLRAIDHHHVSFIPSGRTMDRGPDPLDP